MPRRKRKIVKLNPDKKLKRVIPPAEMLKTLGNLDSIRDYLELISERNVRHKLVFSPNEQRILESILFWVKDRTISQAVIADIVFKRLQRSRNEYLSSIPRYAVFAVVQVFLDVVFDLLIDGWKVRFIGIGALGAEKFEDKLLFRTNPETGQKEYAIVDYYVFYWKTSTGLKKEMMNIYNPAIPWKEYDPERRPWIEELKERKKAKGTYRERKSKVRKIPETEGNDKTKTKER